MNTPNNLSPLGFKDSKASPSPFAPQADWRDMGKSDHFVQFYEDDAFLLQSLSAFLGAGLRAGEGAIVITTKAHRDALEGQLNEDGFNLERAQASGQFFCLDAADALAKFMVNGTPDKSRFFEFAGSLISKAGEGRPGVRTFGEMVALLWAAGNQAAAIRLEDLWNELARAHSFSLFCAYPLGVFEGESNGRKLGHICQQHSRVIPAESYTAKTRRDDRLRAITLLQQKASSLQAETSERKHAESAMREEQTKVNMAVAIAQLGIWELDMESNALTCSEHCKANFGLGPRDALTYKRLFELIHPDDRVAVQTALRVSIGGGADFNTEYRVVDPSGGVRWIASMGRCVHNGARRLLGVVQDITERKRASEILEETVAERTAQLQETIGELEGFSYSISHDMRSPLRAMHGYAKVLLEDYGPKLDAQAATYLERIQRASDRLDLLIRDVLAYSRIAKGQIELKPIPLGPLIEDLIQEYSEFGLFRDSITLEQPLHTVLGHQAYLTQCITNLVGNALKFVAPGTVPRVRIHSEAVGINVRVWVNDNGVGIHPAHYDRIFQIFGRVYPEKLYEGTGIGLAIVKKAVARMGGETGFQSTPGIGSDFWFTLPNASHDS